MTELDTALALALPFGFALAGLLLGVLLRRDIHAIRWDLCLHPTLQEVGLAFRTATGAEVGWKLSVQRVLIVLDHACSQEPVVR